MSDSTDLQLLIRSTRTLVQSLTLVILVGFALHIAGWGAL